MTTKEFLDQPDNNGKLSKEKWILTNNKDAYDEIINYTKIYDLYEIPFKERVYLYIHDLKTVGVCNNSKCNNKTNFKNKTLGYLRYCSNKCQSSSDEIMNKRKNTNIEKYGVEYAIFNEDKMMMFKSKLENRTQDEQTEINEKRKSTNLINFGYDNPSKNPDFVEKRINSFKLNIDSWKESYKNTSNEKYGVEHPWSNKNIYEKCKITSKKLYGVEYPMLNDGIKKKSIINRAKSVENFRINFRNTFNLKLIEKMKTVYNIDISNINRGIYNSNNYSIFFDITNNSRCEHKSFRISLGLFLNRFKDMHALCTVCNNPKSSSDFELKVLEYVKSIYNGEIISSNRSIIKPKELDIYIPELNIAIECNGMYYHNEDFKSTQYHINKFKHCRELGIKLIQIWQDEWNNKKDIIMSRLHNLLCKSNEKIWARKTIIRELNNNQYRKFLEENHIQGYAHSKYKYGLFYNDELVSIMSFCGLRKFMNHERVEGNFELIRFCNKKYTTVVGGASKLFKHFLNAVEVKRIISYSDNNWGVGFYANLGFDDNGVTKPGYYYIDAYMKRHHRFNFFKGKLIKMGFDPKLTEEQIMSDISMYRYWNSGNIKWVWERDEIIIQPSA